MAFYSLPASNISMAFEYREITANTSDSALGLSKYSRIIVQAGRWDVNSEPDGF